jgi:hypothetical protein
MHGQISRVSLVLGFNQDWPNQAKCVKSKFLYFYGGFKGGALNGVGFWSPKSMVTKPRSSQRHAHDRELPCTTNSVGNFKSHLAAH